MYNDGHGFVGDARESTRIPPELVGVHDMFRVVAVVRRREVLLEHRDVEPLLLVRARRTRRQREELEEALQDQRPAKTDATEARLEREPSPLLADSPPTSTPPTGAPVACARREDACSFT